MAGDLVAFLRARLDEDEAGARFMMDREARAQVPRTDWLGSPFGERVLREVEAKRAILAEHQPEPWGEPHPELLRCPGHGDESSGYWTTWPCIEVRAIAAVWRDHPGYDPTWAPQGE
jgi:hypothetical protein